MPTTYEVQISARSGNSKTGPIPTTSRGMHTCPTDCPFLPTGETGGCYGTGRIFALAVKHQAQMTEDEAYAKIAKGMKPGTRLMRDRVVGDIVTPDGQIDHGYVSMIASVAQRLGITAFGYTHAHAEMTPEDAAKIADTGYVLNYSAETPAGVERAVSLGMPVVIANDDVEEGAMIAGRRVLTCPAQTHEGMDCARCGLCAKPQRKAVIRFLLHGAAVKRARRAVEARSAG